MRRRESETECHIPAVLGVYECMCKCVHIFRLSQKPLQHGVSYIMSRGNIKPYTDVKPGNKSDIKPRRVTAACVCRDSFMCITPRYMGRQNAATLNISCFTCGEKPEAYDAFADQTLMSCEKYVHYTIAHNSQRDSQQLPEALTFSRGKTGTDTHNVPNVW